MVARQTPSPAAAVPIHHHWFYDSRIAVSAFCLACLAAIFWQVSVFEGFEPIFHCADTRSVDRWMLTAGMDACMRNARSAAANERCVRTVYILACTNEIWR